MFLYFTHIFSCLSIAQDTVSTLTASRKKSLQIAKSNMI